MKKIPIVMCFSGHDPTGGAGIQADIESLNSLGCRAATVTTALTVQNTRDVLESTALDARQVTAQAHAVLDDMEIAAFKIGMLGSADNAAAIHALLQDYPNLPLVLDPVLAAGGGTRLASDGTTEAIRTLLLPRTTVLTPNGPEARALCGSDHTLDDCAGELLGLGAEYVLITGAHEDTTHVINTLYHANHAPEAFTWGRLEHSYHGSGCTLAAAIAGLLALGLDPFRAVNEAQEFTWNALHHGDAPGKGQHLPDRLFWSRGEE